MKINCAVPLLSILVLAMVGEITPAKLPSLRVINRNEENMINPSRKIGVSHRKQDVFKVTQASPSVVRVGMGERLELYCEVMGSPPPSIQWIKGNNQEQQAELLESNDIMDQISTGRAKTMSRLVVDCVMPQNEGLYTCVATAGIHTTLAPPTMVLIPDNHVNNLTALLTACPNMNNLNMERPPRIVQWSPVSMHDMGDDVTLPCRAVGYPTPTIDWLDADNELISENDQRFKVLPNGDLLVMKLRWGDMAGYTCVASNPRGRDTVVSFLYPVMKSNS